jgi:peptidoglycan/xylan/chitin deacetylase (PgdA/CDA1 family)
MEVGVHGYDHTRMFGMDDVELHRNVVRARDEVAEMMGGTPRSFAYPYGTHDRNARQALEDAGFTVSFAVAREHGRFAVDRVYVKGTDSLRMFRFKLSMAYRFASRVGGRTPWLRHRIRDLVALVRRTQQPSTGEEAARKGG